MEVMTTAARTPLGAGDAKENRDEATEDLEKRSGGIAMKKKSIVAAPSVASPTSKTDDEEEEEEEAAAAVATATSAVTDDSLEAASLTAPGTPDSYESSASPATSTSGGGGFPLRLLAVPAAAAGRVREVVGVVGSSGGVDNAIVKEHWVPDNAVTHCHNETCGVEFKLMVRRPVSYTHLRAHETLRSRMPSSA